MKSLLFTSSTLFALAAPHLAHADHDVRAYMSAQGIDFVAQEAPNYLPSSMELPTFDKSFACMDFQQRNTSVQLSIDALEVSMPEDGKIRVDLVLSGGASGELYADDLYACFGEATCQDSIDIRRLEAGLEFNLSVQGGRAMVTPSDSHFALDPNDLDIEFSGCGFTGTAATYAIDFIDDFLLDYGSEMIAEQAAAAMAPMMEDMLDGFVYEGSYDFMSFRGALADIDLTTRGLALGMEIGMDHARQAAPCVAEFAAKAPSDFAGAAPDLSVMASHANMAFNLGLANKALYAAWREGLMCVDSDKIAALGQELDLSAITVLLPGFPAGTKVDLEVKLAKPPTVVPLTADGTRLTIGVEGLIVDLHGDRPDGTRNTLHAEVDLHLTAGLRIDPNSNAVTAQVEEAEVTRLILEDERKATGGGFDVARLLDLVHKHVAPSLIKKLGTLELTGPAFAYGDYAIQLRKLDTTDAYMSTGIDFFKAPANDRNAPQTTILDYPSTLTNPSDAIVRMTGEDAEIPVDLLQYEVTINGEKQPLRFIRNFKVGEAGKTDTYNVRVAAMDLSGNVDPTPEEFTVEVDGVTPYVMLEGMRLRRADEGPVEIRWSLSDDLTAPENIGVRVDVYEVTNPKDILSTELIESHDLGPGATSTVVELAKVGGVYRVEVHAIDQAGNDGASSVTLTIEEAGGCSVGGKGAPMGGVLLLMALACLRRRRVG